MSHRLSLYAEGPLGDVPLEKFEALSMQRLQLLKSLEYASLRKHTEEDLISHYRRSEDRFLPLHSNALSSSWPLEEERRNDCISHFALTLAFSHSEEAQRWLATHESLLFKMRWLSTHPQERNDWLVSQGLDCTGAVFKVRFEQVPDLVSRRAVQVKEGFALVPREQAYSIVASKFRGALEARLINGAKIMPRLRAEQSEKDRLLPLLDYLYRYSLTAGGLGSNAGAINSDTKITASQIPQLTGHFPPCMQRIHKALTRDSHLKHGARMQFGLFLKSIGLPLEEALEFFRLGYSHKATPEIFTKKYAYGIRHMYGQEGRRVDYGAYSCAKIITSNQPGSGDCHGCPFKAEHGNTREFIAASIGASSAGEAQEVLELAFRGHYQVACTRYYEIKHGGKGIKGGEPMIHPSVYFTSSVAESAQ